jgi:hypothetical protein
MNDTERERIRALNDQPSVHAGPRRREVARASNRRRRTIQLASAAMSVLAVVAVAVVAALLGSSVGGTGGTGGTGSVASRAALPAGAVPWANQPAPAYMAPVPPALAAPQARYAACTAADLTGRLGRFGLGAGHYTRYLVLTNVSNHACTMSGGPAAIVGFRADGSRATLARAGGEILDANLIGPANLQPGRSAQVALTTVYGCSSLPSCRSADYTAVAVGIGSSGRVRVAFPSGQPFTVVNRIEISTFGVPAPPPAQTSSPLDVLNVTIAMPHTLTAGATATYTVTLHNPASDPVTLSPCPSYGEFVSPPGTRLGSALHRYYLNCQAMHAIPANGSVTFGMLIQVPATPGQAKYGWTLQGTSVEAGGAATVVAGS